MMATRRYYASLVAAALVSALLTTQARAGLGGWTFIRGDYDGNGVVDIADGVNMLEYLFIAGTPEPPCLDAADTNDDGVLSIWTAILDGFVE